MIVQGLDTVALLFLIVALAIMLTYILAWAWKFQFTKNQMGFLVVVLVLFGMFIEAWIRETGDELLITIALFVIALLLALTSISRRRRAWRRAGG